MSRTIHTPGREAAPLELADPQTWTNGRAGVYLVQALPSTGDHARPACRWDPCSARARAAEQEGVPVRLIDPCPGTDDAALHGVFLDRIPALHAAQAHYLHPAFGVRRWASYLRAQYAVDLTFEIDAHVSYPATWTLMHEHYEPIVEVAVSIGRLIYDHLVGELGVDRRYITTSVTRMGARLDVDWRAFGPRRCWMVAAVIRTLERRLFPSGLGDYEERLREVLRTSWPDGGEPKLHAELDTRMFEGSDRTRLDGSSRGGTIRGIGSLHSASSNRVMWVRSTPVPHEAFHPAYARRLTEVSRNHKGPMPEDFADPRLFSAKWLLRQPAYRAPQGDARIEPAPNTCARLVALFDEASTLVDELGVPSLLEARERAGLQAARDPGPRGYDVTPEIVRAVAYRVDGSPIDRTSYFRLVCPQCGDQERSAKLFMDTGSFQCFRCNPTGPIGLVQLARMASCLDLVPVRRHSTSTVRRIKLDECDDGAEEPPWSAERVEAPEVETVVEAREAQRVFLEEALASRDQWDMLVLRSPTGTGKTTMAEDAVAASGLLSRGFYARAEGRNRFLEVLQPSRAIDGRQVGGNCHNPKMARATELGVPSYEVCGPKCEERAGCTYMAQFEGAEGHHLALLHAHLPHAELVKFGGRTEKRASTPEIAIIDENPWLQCFETIDLCAFDLDRMRTEQDWRDPSTEAFVAFLRSEGATEFLGVELEEAEHSLGLETSVCTWVGRTPAIEQLIARLVELLHPDSMLTAQRRTLGLRPKRRGRPDETTFVGVLADAELRAVLAADASLRAALERIDDESLKRWVADAKSLFHDEEGSSFRRTPKMVLPQLVEALRDLIVGVEPVGPIHLVHDGKADRWVIRLTRLREMWPGKAIVCSATITPLQAHLAFWARRTWVFAPKIKQREKRFLIADRSYSQTQLKDPKQWERVVESMRSLIARERERTGMAVAVIGNSRVMNRFLDTLLPKGLPKKLEMPWRRGRRDECFDELRALCEPIGVLPGYAGGVAGSNVFVADPNASPPRFVRSLIVLGNILPRLADVAATYRGVFSAAGACQGFAAVDGFGVTTNTPVDWTIMRRKAAIPGTVRGEGASSKVKAIMNMMGFADDRAQNLLHAVYGAELVQIVGRLRGIIPDPEGIEARAYILAGVAVPGFDIDRVLSLDEIRSELGLSIPEGTRPRGVNVENVAQEVKLRGRGETFRRLVVGFFRGGWRLVGRSSWEGAMDLAEAVIQGAGYDVTDAHRARAKEAIRGRDPVTASVTLRDPEDLFGPEV